MDRDLIRYPGFRHGKCYVLGLDDGLDDELIELRAFQTLKFKYTNYELPKNYIINDGATILFWKDGTKTIVKRSKDEKFDKRLGFLTAYFQKHCGMSKTKANKYLDNLVVTDVNKKEK